MNDYTLTFREAVARTATATSFRFSRPPTLDFTAGQYMLLEVGPQLVHPLSLSDTPDNRDFVEFTKRMTASAYSKRLLGLRPGDRVTARGPAGRFVLDGSEERLVFLAGGIGITPIRAILKSLKNAARRPAEILLIYGNNDAGDIAFGDELAHLELPGYRLVHVLLDNSGLPTAHQGFITPAVIRAEVPHLAEAIFMVSGPPAMVKAATGALDSLGVPAAHIRTDVFTGYQ